MLQGDALEVPHSSHSIITRATSAQLPSGGPVEHEHEHEHRDAEHEHENTKRCSDLRWIH